MPEERTAQYVGEKGKTPAEILRREAFEEGAGKRKGAVSRSGKRQKRGKGAGTVIRRVFGTRLENETSPLSGNAARGLARRQGRLCAFGRGGYPSFNSRVRLFKLVSCFESSCAAVALWDTPCTVSWVI